jgi:hypothetical protein
VEASEGVSVHLEIFRPKADRKVRLSLKVCDSGGISLVAVDEDENVIEGGYLLVLRPGMPLLRENEVNPALGFPLDTRGRLMIYTGDAVVALANRPSTPEPTTTAAV